MFFFQIPRLPEAVIRAGEFALLRFVLRRDPVRAGAFTAGDIERYAGAMARPGRSPRPSTTIARSCGIRGRWGHYWKG
jgi:hypothetical protein